ncbi:uncharacterized protein LOC128161112 [Crassostrea angulata]|uniref:uncharacterized protein LOC128161112 n=1 Tax=Magallana angulata TaxID=2784310 RepID=UPI0022B18875|nr:uncharacterized protein LOC128161112 [Crassostrea angulata]
MNNKKEIIQNDLQELEKYNLKYQEITSIITVQKSALNENSQKLTTEIDKHGEDVHREINTNIRNMKSNVGEMDTEHLATLNQQEDEIKHTVSEITQTIAELKTLRDSNDFGSVSSSSIKTEEHGYTMESPGAESSPPDRLLIDVPQLITQIKTTFGESHPLYKVSCLSDEEMWTCGSGNIMSLYNLSGKTVKLVLTKSGYSPYDIAVTKGGDLVYTDRHVRTVNIVKNTQRKKPQITTVIELRGWGPLSVCSTSSGDLLVVMNSDDHRQTKVTMEPMQ